MHTYIPMYLSILCSCCYRLIRTRYSQSHSLYLFYHAILSMPFYLLRLASLVGRLVRSSLRGRVITENNQRRYRSEHVYRARLLSEVCVIFFGFFQSTRYVSDLSMGLAPRLPPSIYGI